ncbi:MAG: C25 family cysteine peptidase, partial [Usitatibacter sp.]
LIAADAKRGLATRVIAIDDARAMAAFRGRKVEGVDDHKGAKKAIDAIDRKLKPHYILILGGPDVVPMQPLDNLMGMMLAEDGDGDDDAQIMSDLPYACDVGYSQDPADFQGPSRVVGRLPDIPGARTPAYLVRLMGFAAKAKPLPAAAYDAWFGLSTETWARSTTKTLKAIFGSAKGLNLSPPKGRRWSARDLAPRLHFVNCHGGLNNPAYYGDDGNEQIRSLTSRQLDKLITPGTVLVAECCYGAQLYDPRASDAETRGQLGIGLEYLRQGAFGVFGSTTTAYGPEDDNDWADVICRVFAERVRAGASLGRAALEARIAYLKSHPLVEPTKLKTIAQFYLLGDPSIHPVDNPRAESAPIRVPTARMEQELRARQRSHERTRLRTEGRVLAQSRRYLKREGFSEAVQQQMLAIAEQAGMRAKLAAFFDILGSKAAYDAGSRSEDATGAHKRVAVLMGKLGEASGDGKGHVVRRAVVIAQVEGDRIVGTPKIAFSK